MSRGRDPLGTLVGMLLIASAILFVVGTSWERAEAKGHREPSAISAVHNASTEPGESREPDEGARAEGRGAESGEDIFGINPESTGLTAAAAAVSVVLAAAILARARREFLLAAVAFGLVFAAFDLRESIHQAQESHADLLTIAAVTALLHLGVSALAAGGLRSGREAAALP